jgi:glucose-6-phosphate-specific signal transduction histidine kinase
MTYRSSGRRRFATTVPGGADPAEGSGLLGLRDRVEAIGGAMHLTSPPGAGTSVRVDLPLGDQAARARN